MKIENHRTAAECFEDYLLAKKGAGIADKTLQSYAEHFHAAGKYIDWSRPIEKIGMTEINSMVSALRDRNLSPRTIATYVIAVKTFFSWAKSEGLSTLNVPLYKCEDST
ncbi:MAG: site-specific integrase, partial [Clostridiales bacterium]|nr:site-specific integrase [Clostridiales bacterium]